MECRAICAERRTDDQAVLERSLRTVSRRADPYSESYRNTPHGRHPFQRLVSYSGPNLVRAENGAPHGSLPRIELEACPSSEYPNSRFVMSSAAFAYDVFLSHSSKDKAVVH
jgi:hypothetical protein